MKKGMARFLLGNATCMRESMSVVVSPPPHKHTMFWPSIRCAWVCNWACSWGCDHQAWSRKLLLLPITPFLVCATWLQQDCSLCVLCVNVCICVPCVAGMDVCMEDRLQDELPYCSLYAVPWRPVHLCLAVLIHFSQRTCSLPAQNSSLNLI